MKKVDVTKFKWFTFKGRDILLKTDHKLYDCSLFTGEQFGLRKYGKKYFLVHGNDLEIRYGVLDKDVSRILSNSEGFEGKIDRKTVKSGKGGLDKSVDDDPNIRHLQIDSSNLKEAFYAKKEKTLYVTFHSDVQWAYEGVTKKEVDLLENAESQGSFFHYRIKSVKDQHKVKG